VIRGIIDAKMFIDSVGPGGEATTVKIKKLGG
jgi:hypothetical protein